ncbi:MAG: DUF1990 domain-containing protein [Acidimicrobiia bacterium]|nr:DUF1990 domain-containing protein [Acidimicrobiia bacterium]
MRLVRLAKPTVEELEELRTAAGIESFNYQPDILDGSAPDAMHSDVTEIFLGAEDATWRAAKRALREWAHFDLGWVGIATGGRPAQPGLDVIVYASLYAIQFTVACRVLSTHDVVDGYGERFGFTYGSLESHVEAGEEKFEVVRNQDGQVFYRIDVVARPARWYAVIAKPLVESQRRRFRQDSATAMKKYVSL